jgi:hypothetical protein
VNGVELARLAAAVAEGGEDFEALAIEDVHLHVRAVGDVEILLLGIAGESDVEGGPVAEGGFGDPAFFDEGAVGAEDLDAVVGAVADVEQAVV